MQCQFYAREEECGCLPDCDVRRILHVMLSEGLRRKTMFWVGNVSSSLARRSVDVCLIVM